MIAVQLESKLEARLQELSQTTGQSQEELVTEAIREHLEDLEDLHTALIRSNNPGRIYSSKEVKRELGL